MHRAACPNTPAARPTRSTGAHVSQEARQLALRGAASVLFALLKCRRLASCASREPRRALPATSLAAHCFAVCPWFGGQRARWRCWRRALCCGLQPFPSQLCAPAACLQFKTIFTGQTLCNGQSKRFGSAETGAVRETPRINACRRAATAHNLFIRDWRAKRCCIEKWVVAWRGMSPVPLTARAKGEDLHRSSAPALQLVGSSIKPVTCPAVQLPS